MNTTDKMETLYNHYGIWINEEVTAAMDGVLCVQEDTDEAWYEEASSVQQAVDQIFTRCQQYK